MADEDFWRQWNSQAAQQWNAYDRGEAAPTPYFGQFQQAYDRNQQYAAMTPIQQHQVQQDYFSNRRAMMQDEQDIRDANARNAIAVQRLRLMERQNNDPFSQSAERLRGLEQGLGANPLELAALADQMPNFQGGMVRLPGRWQYDSLTQQEHQLPGRDIPLDLNTFNYIRQLRGQMIPGYDSAPIQQPMNAPAQQMIPGPAGFAPDKAARLKFLREKMQQGNALAAMPDTFTPQDYAAPN